MQIRYRGRLIIKGLDRRVWHVFRVDLEGDGADRLLKFSREHAPAGTLITTATLWARGSDLFLKPDSPDFDDIVAFDNAAAAALFRISFECAKL